MKAIQRPHTMRHFDYSTPASYFLTTCTFKRALLFEEPAVREIVEATWAAMPEHLAGS
jgi:hypothetical protein